MNIKKALCLILLFLLLFSTVTAISASDDKSYTIDKAFVNLTVENNGLLHVSERYDYSFNGHFNGVYRDIPLKSGESIENIKVSAVGAYTELEETDQSDGKHLKIYLYSDAAHTKGIEDCDVSVYIYYDMVNVVNVFNDVAALQYKVWGENWDVGVEKLSIQANLPGDNNKYYLNPQEFNKTSSIEGNTIKAQTTNIPKGDFYELLVIMPLNNFDNATYAKHVNENAEEQIMKNLENSVNERDFWNTAYIILGLLSSLGPIGAALIYWIFGREPKVDYDGIYERELPTNDPPEVVNALIENKRNIGDPDVKGFEASIMNLIDRKVFRLHSEGSEENLNSELLLTFNNEKINELNESDKIVFNTLKNFSVDNVLSLTKLSSKLTNEIQAIWFMEQFEEWSKSVKKEIDLDEYFNNTGAKLIKVVAIGGLVFGAILFLLGFFTKLKTGIYPIIGGIILLIFSIAMLFQDQDIFGKWSVKGRAFYLKWNNFKKFLKDNSLIEEYPPESIVIWKKYLIYGTALGVADNVYKSMKLHVPNYRGYDDGIIMYQYYGGHYMINSAFETGNETINPPSDSGDLGGFGGLGGGSGGGGGGAF